MVSPSPSTQPLFRESVLQARATRLQGAIVLTPRASGTALALACVAIGLALLAFLYSGTYTRRSTVTGQLLPQAGIIRVHTPQAGVVLEKRVAEGQVVSKGDVLYVLSSDRPGLNERGLQAGITWQVEERIRSLEAELARNRLSEAGELSHLERRMSTLRAESQSIARQIEQQTLRLRLADEAKKRYQLLADKEFIAKEQVFQREAELSEQTQRLQALEQSALVAQRELATTEREIDATRMRYSNQQAMVTRSISSSQQELAEVDAKGRVVVTAPEAGRATLIAAELGQAVDASRPLASLIPQNSSLVVRLYAPSRAIGFVRVGDAVLLRYQAFAFQKFGQHDGTVESISTTAVPSTELTGFTLADITPGEPIYAVTVRIKSQTVLAYGEAKALQAGMRVDADILQETRRLYEWALEPLYSISGGVR